MLAKKSLVLSVFLLFCASFAFAESEEELLNEVEQVQAEIQLDTGNALLGLKIEVLNWKKKYYIEHSLFMQLREMNRLWGTPEFQEVQREIRGLDRELKRLSAL